MRRIKKYLCLLLIVALGSGLMACENASINPTKIGRDVRAFEALTEIKDGRKNIYFISKSFDNHYWDTMAGCIRQAADALDCNVYYSASTIEAEWETQVELLDMAVKERADAIIIAPDNSMELAVPISEVYKNGMPVVLIDTAVTLDDYDVCFMTDNLIAGERAAREMIYQLKRAGVSESEKAQIGIQVGSATSQTINERLAGFSQYWSYNAPANWTLIDDIKINGGDSDLGREYAAELVENYPDIKGLFGANNGSTVAFAKEVAENKRTDLVIVGFDFSDEIAALIRNEDYYVATILQKQYNMGYKSVQAAIEASNGHEPKEKFVDTGVVIANGETIDSASVKSVLDNLQN